MCRILLGVPSGPVQIVGRQLGEEAARLVGDDLAEALAPFGVRQRQLLLRARDADVEQAALFLDAPLLDAALVRQCRVVDADEEDEADA